jgi:hypothetical protein
VDPVFEQGKFLETEVYNKNQIYRRTLTMRKFIFSLVFFGSFAFLYLVAFSTHARAFTLCQLVCEENVDSIKCEAGAVVCAGTHGPDAICGSDDGDVIAGGAGDDIICAQGGDDTIFGGPGDDLILGAEGNDIIYGASGDDSLSGGVGDDTILAGPGSDAVSGGDGFDTCIGSLANDTFDGCEYQP